MKQVKFFLLALIAMLSPLSIAAQTSISIEDFDIKAGEAKEMVIDLNNPGNEITLVQFDLRLPDGLSVAMDGGEYAIDIAGRTTYRNHSLDANATDGIIRFLLASTKNAVLEGTSGAIISISLTANSSFNGGTIRLENILLVTPDEKEVKPADVEYVVGSDTIPDGEWHDGDMFIAKTVEGIEMKFRVLSAEKHTCQVGWKLSSQELEDGVFDEYVAIDPNTKGSITIPLTVNGLQVLGVSHGAFAECEGITSVVIPEGSVFIGGMAFYGCNSLTSVILPESLISIGYNTEYKESWYSTDYVFGDCKSLTSITIPKNVTLFGRFIFFDASELKSIYSEIEDPTDVGMAFNSSPYDESGIGDYATLYVPVGTKAKYQAAKGWKNFKNIVEVDGQMTTSAYLSIEPFSIKASETKELVIDLTNPEDEITLVQFDLHLPSGLSINQTGSELDFDMCDRTTWRKHNLDANMIDDYYRFLLYSGSNALISGTEGALIKITLKATNDFDYHGQKIVIDNALLVSPEQKEIKPRTYEYMLADPSGIADAKSETIIGTSVYTLSGQRLNAPKKGFNIIGGKKVIIK